MQRKNDLGICVTGWAIWIKFLISTVNSMFISSYPNIFNDIKKWIFFSILFLLLVYLKWDSLSNYIFLLLHILAALTPFGRSLFFGFQLFMGCRSICWLTFIQILLLPSLIPTLFTILECFVSLIFNFFLDSFLFYFSLTPWQWRADRQGLWCWC